MAKQNKQYSSFTIWCVKILRGKAFSALTLFPLVFSFIYAQDQLDEWIWFCILFGGSGFVLGLLWETKWLRPYLRHKKLIGFEFDWLDITVSNFIMALLLFSAGQVNSIFADSYCDKFPVTNKYMDDDSRPLYKLVVRTNDGEVELSCTKEYWNQVIVQQLIPVCLNQGALGFDFKVLPDDPQLRRLW